MKALYKQMMSTCWRNETATCSGNNHRLRQPLRNVTGESVSVNTLPRSSMTRFSQSTRPYTLLYDVPLRSTSTLDCWSPVTMDEAKKLISSAPCKTCQLDPAATWLIKDVKLLLSPFIVLLFNKSLASGSFPHDFRYRLVRCWKKMFLDASQIKEYRLVSNLSFLSKILERAIQSRLQEFLDSNNMMPETVTLSPEPEHRDCCNNGA